MRANAKTSSEHTNKFVNRSLLQVLRCTLLLLRAKSLPPMQLLNPLLGSMTLDRHELNRSSFGSSKDEGDGNNGDSKGSRLRQWIRANPRSNWPS